MSIENDKILVYGQDSIIEKINEKIKDLKKGNGNLIFVEGDMGFGKSNFLDKIQKEIRISNKDIRVLRTKVQAPIVDYKSANLQPFQPFINLLQEMNKPDDDAKIRLVKNITMTVLASIPGVEQIAYPIKEISKDLREYKNDQMLNNKSPEHSFYYFFLDSLNKKIKDKKVLLLIDDVHWCDAQSISLLSTFITNNYNDKMMIVATYNQTLLDNLGLPLISIINNETYGGKILDLKLNPLDLNSINSLAKIYFKNYKQNFEFEEWIREKSNGNPGMILEYLKHFSQMSPFDENGNLATNFKDNEFLPGTWNALFAQKIEDLSEEDKHVLSICASEGVEFTATIISRLLSLDVVETIRKLKKIQNKTGLIKSLGPQLRYGIKTTTYTFSQTFHQVFFKNKLEYEENLELQSKISELLKIQYLNMEDEELKKELALQLASHSIESGDNQTAEEALYFAAQKSSEIGGDEYLESIKSTIQRMDPNAINILNSIENLKAMNNFVVDNVGGISNFNSVDNFGDIAIDFKNIKKSVVNDIINDNIQIAESKITMYLEKYNDHFNNDELVQLYSLLSKIYVDLNKIGDALSTLKNTEKMINTNVRKNTIALFNNSFALYYYNVGDIDNAFLYLNKNEELIPYMGADTKILTSALISQISKKTSQENYRKYKNAALKLIEELNFDTLRDEISNY